MVSKVASGAAEVQPAAVVGNLARFLDFLKDHGIWVIGADATAEESVFDVDLARPVALVVGSEGRGLRRLTRERCDLLVRLPMALVQSVSNRLLTKPRNPPGNNRRPAPTGWGSRPGVARSPYSQRPSSDSLSY